MFAGVMLSIGVILGGYWKRLPPAEFLEWFAQHGELVMHAIPLVFIPILIGLIGAARGCVSPCGLSCGHALSQYGPERHEPRIACSCSTATDGQKTRHSWPNCDNLKTRTHGLSSSWYSPKTAQSRRKARWSEATSPQRCFPGMWAT